MTRRDMLRDVFSVEPLNLNVLLVQIRSSCTDKLLLNVFNIFRFHILLSNPRTHDRGRKAHFDDKSTSV